MSRKAIALMLAIAAVASLGLGTLLAGYALVRAAGGRGTLGPSLAPGLGPRANVSSLKEAEIAFDVYVERLGYDNLRLTEVMEFEQNYYAIVAEEATGIGAMELLLDKRTGAVTPERGPNMMWNAKYGMHRGGGMMGRAPATDAMTVAPDEAAAIAQRWLDANLPGREPGEADAFYGYYTLHFVRDGRVEGMLSVHGSTGQLWYHDWHGAFVQMTGHED
jgi:hypothetical protein